MAIQFAFNNLFAGLRRLQAPFQVSHDIIVINFSDPASGVAFVIALKPTTTIKVGSARMVLIMASPATGVSISLALVPFLTLPLSSGRILWP